MNTVFETKKADVYMQLSTHPTLVLATCTNNKVSARTMSFVIIDDILYFQTDIQLRKYNDIKHNANVALCIDNIQIEGICKELGHPLMHQQFCELFTLYHKNSYKNYSSLKDERLFSITPTFIQRWCYIDNSPIMERFYFDKKEYLAIPYQGK